MNNLILLALVATALGANKQCTKFADLKPDEQYYLRFLTKVDYDKDTSKAFTTDEPETGAYIGFDETTDAYSNFKIGEKSKFTIEKVQNGIRVRSTDSKLAEDAYNQKRTFYWQKDGIMGYYMHKSSANDYFDLYTLLMYDSENYSLKAAQGNPAKPITLATHDVEGDTAIYPQNSNAKVKESKFCFQNVAQDKPNPPEQKQCQVEENLTSTIAKANAAFDAKCDVGNKIDENDTCEAKCIHGGTNGVYTCKDERFEVTTKPECWSKTDEDFEKIEQVLTEELSKLNEQDKQDAIEWIKKNVSTLKDKNVEEIKQAFDDYLKDQKTKKKNSVAQYGVFIALVCLLALH